MDKWQSERRTSAGPTVTRRVSEQIQRRHLLYSTANTTSNAGFRCAEEVWFGDSVFLSLLSEAAIEYRDVKRLNATKSANVGVLFSGCLRNINLHKLPHSLA